MMGGACPKHPAAGRIRCTKYGKFLCRECGRCPSPKIHCGHRTSCIIWETSGGEGKRDSRSPAAGIAGEKRGDG